jgi:lipopolysaccharide export LptBFGC system permease protein LptF
MWSGNALLTILGISLLCVRDQALIPCVASTATSPRTFLSCYAVTFLFFVGLFIVVDLISSAEKFIQTAGEEHWSFVELAQRVVTYYLLFMPTIFLQVAPFMTVISGIAAVARLRKNNEVIPIVMAGCSTFRMLVPIFALSGC